MYNLVNDGLKRVLNSQMKFQEITNFLSPNRQKYKYPFAYYRLTVEGEELQNCTQKYKFNVQLNILFKKDTSKDYNLQKLELLEGLRQAIYKDEILERETYLLKFMEPDFFLEDNPGDNLIEVALAFEFYRDLPYEN